MFEWFCIQQEKEYISDYALISFVKHYKYAKHIDKGEAILLDFFLISSIISCILKTLALENKSKNLKNSVKTSFSGWKRQGGLLF